MIHRSPRPWFRVSLSTLFIIITVSCCWLAWQMSIVRQRKAVLSELKQNGEFTITTAAEHLFLIPPGMLSDQSRATVSPLRTWLGDEAIQTISYTSQPSAELRQRIARTFPEAELQERQILYEPCHPGCFPQGTMVETPSGKRAIETLAAGDEVTMIGCDHAPRKATIEDVFVTDNRLWRVETESGVLITTETQPLCLTVDKLKSPGELEAGEKILRWHDGALCAVAVLSVEKTDRVGKVYNLILGNKQVFVANGYLARSKPPKLSDFAER